MKVFTGAQVLGNKNGVWVVDDYAHNPVNKAGLSVPVNIWETKWWRGCNLHGYTPTKFLRQDFVKKFGSAFHRMKSG